jgi:hypothetical protein
MWAQMNKQPSAIEIIDINCLGVEQFPIKINNLFSIASPRLRRRDNNRKSLYPKSQIE